MLKVVIQCMLFFLPWRIRRRLLNLFFNFDLDQTSHIGFSFFFNSHLTMSANSKIGHLNVFKDIARVQLHENSSIGRLNWISGFPLSNKKNFQHVQNRKPELIIREHAAITNRHLVDCTDLVHIGKYSTVAGYRSQILTHSIDLHESRQSCKSVYIGDYCFVGTSSVLLGGSKLPDYSVLGACSLLNEHYQTGHTLYGGVPARPITSLNSEMKYFHRKTGFVN